MINSKLGFLLKTIQFPNRFLAVSPLFGWVLRGSLAATCICTGLIVTFKGVGSLLSSNVAVDTLTAYDSILPGMPMSALAQFPCHYQTNGVNQQLVPARLSCTIFLQDALFDSIHVELDSGYITAVNFYASELQVGQIALHWQPTQPMQFTKHVTKWASGAYTIIVSEASSEHKNRSSVVQITANMK